MTQAILEHEGPIKEPLPEPKTWHPHGEEFLPNISRIPALWKETHFQMFSFLERKELISRIWAEELAHLLPVLLTWLLPQHPLAS